MSLLTPETKAALLIAEDSPELRKQLVPDFAGLGFDVREARDGAEALRMMREAQTDLLLSDVSMPQLDGIALCRAVKEDPALRLIPVVLMTAADDPETSLRAIEAGADDVVAKPFNRREVVARMRVLVREHRRNLQLDAAENVVFAMARAVAARNPYTIYHAERVAQYAAELGRAHGLGEPDCVTLYRGGILHDIGEIALPDRILLKPARLSNDEMEVVRKHPVEGEEICAFLQGLRPILPIIRHHHERFDGRGYPDGLRGEKIPLAARIIAVADAWAALRSGRPHRAGLSEGEALETMRMGAGSGWDPRIVELLTRLVGGGASRVEA